MATASPRIVSRADWGANPLNTPAGTIAVPTPDLWLHHTGGSGSGAGYMRSLQQGALRGGYVDLEYSLVVDNRDGTIYMSRGVGRNTAATGGSTGGQANNSRSHAICAMGNFENEQPSAALLDGIASCVLWLHAQRGIATARITGPHRDAPGNATACCGRNLIARIGDINAMVGNPGPAPGPTPPPAAKGGAVEIVTHPNGKGYWITNDKGAVFAYGSAKYFGGANTLNNGKGPNAPIVGMSCTASGNGYYLLGQDGGVFAYGDAAFYGAPTGKV